MLFFMEQENIENMFFKTKDENGNEIQYFMVKQAKMSDGREFGLAIKLDTEQLNKMEKLDAESIEKAIEDALLLRMFNRPDGPTVAEYLKDNDDYYDVLNNFRQTG